MLPHHHVAIALAVAAAVQGGALALEQWQPRAMEACAGAAAALTAVATLLARGTFFPRQLACTLLMVGWGVRLSWHLAVRDVAEQRLPARRLCMTRTLWSAVVALPVVAVNSLQAEAAAPGPAALVGALLAAAGLALETVADAQKAAWHAQHARRPLPSDGEPPVCARGTWAWSRHSNLAGEVAFHSGVYALVAAVTPPVVAAAPLATLLIVVVLPTGPLRTLEREKDALYSGYPAYLKYRDKTSIFLPCPPTLYAAAQTVCPILH
jgi:steroid 5-alpha reductase family enzyme